jgi:hypothetical protein
LELFEKQAIDNKRKGVVGSKGKTTPIIAKASDKKPIIK